MPPNDAATFVERTRRKLVPVAPTLDNAIADACQHLYDRHRWSAYELRNAGKDLVALSRGDDCCYDRPSIGLAYALWYHGRRVQGIVKTLLPALVHQSGDLTVIDLGCGTGATAWAVALIEQARRQEGASQRTVHVYGVDASPFMQAAGNCLWKRLEALVPDGVIAEFVVGNWAEVFHKPEGRLWLTAGFLFDASDRLHIEDLADTFGRVVSRCQPDSVFLLGSSSKKALMARASQALVEGNYTEDRARPVASLWHGPMDATTATRRDLFGATTADPALLRPCRWMDSTEPCVRVLHRVGAVEGGLFDDRRRYRLPALDEIQRAAAESDGRLTYVHGAAGSGKSRVLVERVVRTLEEDLRRKDAAILVTTFNKDLIRQLCNWLAERINASPILDLHTPAAPFGDDVRLVAKAYGRQGSIRLLNWDKAPPRLFGVRLNGDFSHWEHSIEERLSRRLSGLPQASGQRLAALLTAGFLKAEFARVIYGLVAYERQGYLKVRRRGRQKHLQSADREIVWDVLMGRSTPPSFTAQRIAAHQWLVRNGREPGWPLFQHVFIDEVQDFSQADFDLVTVLVERPQHIVACCDEAQALHLGTSYWRPTVKGARWNPRPLRGSYRLPIRVCEAVRPLAERIAERRRLETGADDAEMELLLPPESVKSAVLGPRPVLVAGGKTEVREALRSVLCSFAPLLQSTASDEQVVCVAEEDDWMQRRLREVAPRGMTVRMESMRKIKGLERPCVVLSTRANIPHDDSLHEWIYTVLTRTTALLVIALSQGTRPELREVISLLRSDRLLFWNEAAEDVFTSWVQSPAVSPGRRESHSGAPLN